MPVTRPRSPMSRRAWALLLAAAFIAAATLLAAGAARAGSTALQPADAGRPNVVLIVADDMRVDGLQAMPALGRLAERGVTFTNAFATTPLCCPSRASILTGRYARHHGVQSNLPPNGGVGRFDDRSTLATWLQASGVRTGLVGRYLNGYRSRKVPPGWDHWFALQQGDDDVNLYYRYEVNHNGADESYGSQSEDYSTRVLGRRAVRFVEAEPARPFMLLFAPRAPHGPATPDPNDAGAFKDLELAPAPSYDEEDLSDKAGPVRALGRLSARDHERMATLRRRQFETLLGLDRAIEQLVETLRAGGRLDRTWIIFTSDNGLTLGEHRLTLDKACPYEECARVPLVVVPPGGLDGPRTDDRLVANVDLAPTIAQIMGVAPEPPTDGQSLLPLIEDPAAPWRDALTLEAWSDRAGNRGFTAIRTADRKYVRHEGGDEELYDLAADPHELQSLAADPTRAAERTDLATRLDSLLAAFGNQPDELR